MSVLSTITQLAKKASRLPSPPAREFYGTPPAVEPTPGEYLSLHLEIDRLLDTLTRKDY